MIDKMKNDFEISEETNKKMFQKELEQYKNTVNMLKADMSNLEEFKKEKSEFTKNEESLKKELEMEKKNGMAKINELERDKIQTTEQLRKEMLYKIKETKANLLALNDEQLQTTTKLTILQNHQLTTELEYQSRQTEQLLFKNNKMKEQIDTLKRDIQIHKEVEKELAKRSHFCQKVIKKLRTQVKELEAKKPEH